MCAHVAGSFPTPVGVRLLGLQITEANVQHEGTCFHTGWPDPCTQPWRSPRSLAGWPPGLLGSLMAATPRCWPASQPLFPPALVHPEPRESFPSSHRGSERWGGRSSITQRGSSRAVRTSERSQTPKSMVWSPQCTAFLNTF